MLLINNFFSKWKESLTANSQFLQQNEKNFYVLRWEKNETCIMKPDFLMLLWHFLIFFYIETYLMLFENFLYFLIQNIWFWKVSSDKITYSLFRKDNIPKICFLLWPENMFLDRWPDFPQELDSNSYMFMQKLYCFKSR